MIFSKIIDNCFIKLYLKIIPITLVVVFIGYFPVLFNMDANVSISHVDGTFISYNRSNPLLNIYYGNKWVLGKNTDDIVISTHNNGYDVDKLIFNAESGIEKITFHNFSTSIWGIETVNTSGIDLGQHTYLNGGITPYLEGDDFVLAIDNPDQESMFMITGYDFIPFWFWIIYGIIVLLVNAVFTFIVDKILSRFNIKWEGTLLSISITVTALLMGMSINNTLSYITYDYFFLNWIIVFIICNIINCFTVHYAGTIIGTFALLVGYIANYYVILYRQKPISPSDFYAIGTAGEVLGGYNIVPTPKMIIYVLIWIIMCVCLVLISKKENKKVSLKNRAIGIAVSVVLFVLCLNNPIYNSLNTFVWNAKQLDDFYSEGMVLSFTRNYFSSFVREPSGYSKDKVNEYLKKYQNEKVEEKEVLKPTKVIMIMNEAFSDLRSSGMPSSVDVMPYIDSMDENTMIGSVYASVLGGGTCNTEFEGLTGNSMAFLPAGYYPFVQCVKDDMFSLATYFKQYNYNTSAFHPGAKDSWNRNIVYPLFSFDKFYSAEEFENIEYLHKLPSDLSDYKFIESVDKKESGSKFYFNVTYQNHSGYESWEDVPKNESAMQIPATDAQIYLSLIAESDKAVEQLIEYYKTVNEPTMIIFFGDHQPGLGVENDYYIYNNNVGGLNKYQTKFFIWTNYETEQIDNAQVSANYLPLLALERGGFELPPYLKMLKEVYEKYPIITAQGIVDKDGNFYSGTAELADDPLIQMYQNVQYANMFDEIDEAWFKTK